MAAYQFSATDLSASATGFQSRPTGATSPVTCGACGCRLDKAADDGSVYRHFTGTPGRDARGCSVACAAADHDAHGVAIATA